MNSLITGINTVDGRNPAPPDMYEPFAKMINLQYQLVIAGFLNHQQYDARIIIEVYICALR